MANSILVAKNISKSYVGVQALDNVNVSINEGEVKCLAGENGSGKSTFVKIVAGVEQPDSGEIYINGQLYPKMTPISAISAGIQIIYQDLSLFSNMTVAENIAMNKLVKENRKSINKQEVKEIAQKALDMVGVTMDLNAKVQGISIANRQIIAICRALALDTKILFMDEPTTALTRSEIEKLLDIVNNLKNRGLAIVFISHKLDEMLSVADSITVFRDGKQVADLSKSEITRDSIVFAMTGREIEYNHYIREAGEAEPLLKLSKLTKQGHFYDVDLSVRPGDIMGITGLLGSGRTELALSIFGLNPPDSGKIVFGGKDVKITNPVEAVDMGIALLPEDRGTQGLLLDKDLTDNVSSAVLDKVKGGAGVLNNAKRLEMAENAIKSLKIRIPNAQTMIKTLSGGNQQKVVIGKWKATQPKLFILDTPTVGVDIGSKAEIYDQVQKLAREGIAVIIISDEIEEIVANCNRVSVMFKGSIVREFGEEDMRRDDIDASITEVINSLHLQSKSKDGEAV